MHPILHQDLQDAVNNHPGQVFINPQAGYLIVATKPESRAAELFNPGRHVGRAFFCQGNARSGEYLSVQQRAFPTLSPDMVRVIQTDMRKYGTEDEWRAAALDEISRNLSTSNKPLGRIKNIETLMPRRGGSDPTGDQKWDFNPTPVSPPPTKVEAKKPRAKPKPIQNIDF